MTAARAAARHRRACRRLAAADPVMAGLIARIGAARLPPAPAGTHFAALARTIVHQQLAGKAAAAIYLRFRQACGGRAPSAATVLRLSDAALRAAGLSRAKAACLRDLAARTADGRLRLNRLAAMEDDTVITALTAVKGIGRWSAQMFLLFHLGRPDVLPELDYGVRKAIQAAYRRRRLPTPAQVLKFGAPWHPEASTATWYLWRSLEPAAGS